jgi:hypothetical protein
MLADFVFQSAKLVENRNSAERKTRFIGNVQHTLIYLILSILCTIYYFSVWVLVLTLALSFFHFAIDFSKSNIFIKWPSQKHNFLIFIGDQFLHFSLLILCWYIYCRNFSTAIIFTITLKSKLINFINSCLGNLTYNQKILLSLCLIVTALWAVGIGIRAYFDYLKYKPNKNALKQGFDVSKIFAPSHVKLEGGFIIGILERLFIICAVILKMEQIIGFMLATKSIARFKKFDDDYFVESFIIGSLISFISAIIIGVIIRSLKIISY